MIAFIYLNLNWANRPPEQQPQNPSSFVFRGGEVMAEKVTLTTVLESSFSRLPLQTPTQVLRANRRVPVKSHGVIGGDMKFSKCH